MKTAALKNSREMERLRIRLDEAQATLRAIRSGDVDAVVIAGRQGPQVFTLQGAEHEYRVLIESMNEGALTLTAGKTILYANNCFARMVNCPLEQVIGGSLGRFLSAEDRTTLRSLLKRTGRSGRKIQMMLNVREGSRLPVTISIRPLAKETSRKLTFGLVVTDMTESRRTEELLRALTQRVVQVQEAERGRVALELHDNITQLLCAGLVRSQVLADRLSAHNGPARKEAIKLRELLGLTAGEVERISRNLRPGVLKELGLNAVLNAAGTEFAARTGVSFTLAGASLTTRLPAESELALYRILQEALLNVETHARAHHVTVRLKRERAFVELVIQDDGIGFKAHPSTPARSGKDGLGLLSMHERASYVGGTIRIHSNRRTGTKIEVRIPVPVLRKRR